MQKVMDGFFNENFSDYIRAGNFVCSRLGHDDAVFYWQVGYAKTKAKQDCEGFQ